MTTIYIPIIRKVDARIGISVLPHVHTACLEFDHFAKMEGQNALSSFDYLLAEVTIAKASVLVKLGLICNDRRHIS